jgi:hypothetical protein
MKDWNLYVAQTQNRTYSLGNQNLIAPNEFRRRLEHIGAGRADCGQYAAGRDAYQVGSIDPNTGAQQLLGRRNPVGLDLGHLRTGDVFVGLPIPPGAEGIAFNNPFDPPGGWHYGRLEPDGTITMADANRQGLGMQNAGGSFNVFDSDMNTLATAGVQPIRHLASIAHFVDYCDWYYLQPGQRGSYWFVYFGD